MKSLQEIEQKVDKLLAGSNVRVQTEVLNGLIQQVREYATATAEAKNLADDIRDLRRQIEKNEQTIKSLSKSSDKSDDDNSKQAYALQQEVLQMEQTLAKAEQAETRYKQSREVLRAVERSVEDLRSQIKRSI